MLNKKIIIVSLTFLGILGFVFSAQAILISQVNFINFSMEKADFVTGEEIRGNFTLKNYEEEVVPDITYSYRLLAEDPDGFYTIILDEQFSGDNFSLGPEQKITKSFSYRLPQNLPSGNHKFRTQLFNSKGISMSRKDSDITVQSDNKFLTLENHFFLENDQKLLPKGEAVYDASQAPQVILDISNNSSFQISASPRMTFYYYDVTENVFQNIEKESITLASGETQSQTLDLIDFKEPGIYLCRLALYENNNIISNSVDFRWTIRGKDIEIMQFRIDKSSYQEGDRALIVVDIANVSELSTEDKGNLQVTIYDKEGSIAGEKTEEISLEGGKIKIEVPITENVVNPRVDIVVVGKGQEILDRYQAQTRDEKFIEEAIGEEPSGERNNNLLIILILLIVIVAFMVYFLKKRSSATKATFIFLFLGGTLLLASSVLAAASVILLSTETGFPEDPTANINWDLPLPTPDYFHEAGAYVQCQGRIFLSDGSNIKNNEIKFFISGPEDLVLKEEGGIWVIDENPAVNPGLIILGTTIKNNAVPELAYNETFQIPIDIPHTGEEAARFYVQYKGERAADGDLKWVIAYRDATIQVAGEGGLYINLESDKAGGPVGEEINWTVDIGNKLPCIRNPVDVIEVLDRSGSMSSDGKMGATRDAAKLFVDEMNPVYDRIGLVSYNQLSTLNIGLTTNFPLVKNKIDSLAPSGQTCIGCGMEDAHQEIMTNGREVALYILLMTDGLANEPEQSGALCDDGCYPGSADYAVSRVGPGVITFYTIGFGSDACGIPPQPFVHAHGSSCCGNPPTPGVPTNCCGLLNTIASLANGDYYYAPTGDELQEVFKTIAGIITGESPATKVEIDIPDSLEITSYDARCTVEGNKLICDVGDLACGDETYVAPFTFTTEVVSGDPGQELEVVATVFNGGGKLKNDTGTVKVTSLPSAEITSPDPIYWLKEDFEASFRYFDATSSPGLAICEYRIESKTEGEPGFIITKDWTSACNCSSTIEATTTKNITVGAGKDCQYQGEDVCRISVRAINLWGGESREEGNWQRLYDVDWTAPGIDIE